MYEWLESLYYKLINAYRHIVGKGFAIQWICELLDVNIYIWNRETKDISTRLYSSNTCSKALYLMHLPISKSHAHFHPLLQIHNVENINPNNKIPQLLQRIMERETCNSISSVPYKYLVRKESSFTRSCTQLNHLSIDHKIWRKRKLLKYQRISHHQIRTIIPLQWRHKIKKKYLPLFQMDIVSDTLTYISWNMQCEHKVL